VNHPPATLIVGCGYLGQRLAAKLLDRPDDQRGPVWATTRSDDHARRLLDLGLRPMILRVTQPLTYTALQPALDHPGPLDVAYLVPPGRPGNQPNPRQTVVGGVAHTLKHLRHAPRLRRAVLASSSAVYGHQPDTPVTAESPALADNPRARLLLDGETLWLNANQSHDAAFHVLRLAGLYGPGRVIGQRAVAEQHPLAGDPDAPLNLIHIDDAAACLLAMLDAANHPATIELAADGHPLPRRDYYNALANLLHVPPPRHLTPNEAVKLGIDPARLKAASHKSLDPHTTRDRLAWTPQHPSVLDALPALLGDSPPPARD